MDNVGFFEYAKLPGIICDRFFHIFLNEKDKTFIQEEKFVEGFMKVYHSGLNQKMKMVFDM